MEDYDGQIVLEHNETITINGNGAVLDRAGSNESRFFYLANGFTGSLALESITLQNGHTGSPVSRTITPHLALAEHQVLLAMQGVEADGGAIWVGGGSLIIKNGQFLNNEDEWVRAAIPLQYCAACC
jgi:hypothetical protein